MHLNPNPYPNPNPNPNWNRHEELMNLIGSPSQFLNPVNSGRLLTRSPEPEPDVESNETHAAYIEEKSLNTGRMLVDTFSRDGIGGPVNPPTGNRSPVPRLRIDDMAKGPSSTPSRSRVGAGRSPGHGRSLSAPRAKSPRLGSPASASASGGSIFSLPMPKWEGIGIPIKPMVPPSLALTP